MRGGTNKVPQIFGDGSDGAVIVNSNTTWSAETEDTGMIVKNFETLIIPNEVTVSAGNRNCGMIIRVQGDCTIAGTLANKLSCKTLLSSDNVDFSSWPLTMLSGKAGDGGTGGKGLYNDATTPAAGMTGRFYGGGWSGGGASRNHAGGSSNNITTATEMFVGGLGAQNGSFGGGAGGRAGAPGFNNLNTRGGNGPGENGSAFSSQESLYTYYSAGGAGNIGGGVILLFVGGNLTITGSLDCSGNKGGNGGTNAGGGNGSFCGSGGGGSGGGRIFICYKGTFSNAGTLNVSGGVGGAVGKWIGLDNHNNGYPGAAGGDGTTAIKTYDQYKEEDVA